MTEKRTVVQIRASEEEIAAWKASAKGRQMSLSAWVRRLANSWLERERA